MHTYTHARTQTTTDKTRRTVAAASLVAVSRFLEPPALGVVSTGRLEEDGSVEASLSTILSLSSHLDLPLLLLLLLLLRIRGVSFSTFFEGKSSRIRSSISPSAVPLALLLASSSTILTSTCTCCVLEN